MTKLNFYLRGFNTKVLFELSARERRHILPLTTVTKVEKNTAVQIKFLFVNTKYINFSFLIPNYWIYLFHRPSNLCVKGYLIK